MSAYICDPETFKALALFAVANCGEERGAVDASAIAETLYQENIRSVRARYPNDNRGDLPGPNILPLHMMAAPEDQITYGLDLSPTAIIALCDCLESQSCETEDWNQTSAYQLVKAIRAVARRNMNEHTRTHYAIEQEARQAIRAAEVSAVRTEYPHLVQRSEKLDSLIAASKNARTELKAAFPPVKFSIKTRRYSGGDSMDISWTDGPTTSQVEQIADKYAGGSFDGMTDSYSDARTAFNDVFGDAKYVSCDRSYSDKMLNSIIGRVCRRLGGMNAIPTAEDYNRGRLWEFKQSGGCDVSQHINTALSRHTYCI